MDQAQKPFYRALSLKKRKIYPTLFEEILKKTLSWQNYEMRKWIKTELALKLDYFLLPSQKSRKIQRAKSWNLDSPKLANLFEGHLILRFCGVPRNSGSRGL